MKNNKNKVWKHGQKAELARLAGISRQYLNGVLSGRNCPRKVARRLENAANYLELNLSATDLLNSDITANPLFHNKRNSGPLGIGAMRVIEAQGAK